MATDELIMGQSGKYTYPHRLRGVLILSLPNTPTWHDLSKPGEPHNPVNVGLPCSASREAAPTSLSYRITATEALTLTAFPYLI